LDHLCSSFGQGSSATVWIRDLTEEGIEPNAGRQCALMTCLADLTTGVLRDGEIFCSEEHWYEWLEAGSVRRSSSLSPSHQVEMTGMQIIQRVVAQRGNIFDNVVMASAQSSATDLTYRGAPVPVKAASKTCRNKYHFSLHHGKFVKGKTNRKPYDVGIAFIFVVTTCTDRFYLVSAEKAKKLKIVGKGAPTCIRLPHPDECALDSEHEYFPLPLPATARLSSSISPSSGVKRS
jgi:hypothetical protein